MRVRQVKCILSPAPRPHAPAAPTTLALLTVARSPRRAGLLQQGDTIVAVDSAPVSADTIHAALLGVDRPGSLVTVSLLGPPAAAATREPPSWRRPGPAEGVDGVRHVVLTRMDSGLLTERLSVLEAVQQLQVRARTFARATSPPSPPPASRSAWCGLGV